MNQQTANRARTRIGVIALALLASLVFAGSASASNFGAFGGVFFANGNNHYFFYYNTSAFTNDQTNWVRAVDLDPTDLATFYTSSHDASDVTISDSVDGPSYGFYQCQAVSPSFGDRCNHAHVHIYTSWNASATTRRSTLCQEVGHSLGLQHDGSGGCMNSAANSPYFTSHDVAHINGRY